MRFDDYLQQFGAVARPVDRFDGFEVLVEVPPEWESYDAAIGGWLWIRRSDLGVKQFCSNAVLTMHQIDAALDSSTVFAALSDTQLQSIPGASELRRDLTSANEGPGVEGTLRVQIAHKLGTLDSVSHTRIITTEDQTLIAQLTLTTSQPATGQQPSMWLGVHDRHTADPASHVTIKPIARPYAGPR